MVAQVSPGPATTATGRRGFLPLQVKLYYKKTCVNFREILAIKFRNFLDPKLIIHRSIRGYILKHSTCSS